MRRRAMLATAASVGLAGCASRLRGLFQDQDQGDREETPTETTLSPMDETATSTERTTSGPQPEFEVTELKMPETVRPYQRFNVTVGVRNRGDAAGLFWTQFVVLDNTGVVDTRTLTINVDANSIGFTELGPFMFQSYGLREMRTVEGGGMARLEVTPVEYGFGETHVGSRFTITIDRTAVESTVTADGNEYPAAAGWRFLITSITVKSVYDSTPPNIDAFGVMAGERVIRGTRTLTRFTDGGELDQSRIDRNGQAYSELTPAELSADETISGWAVFEVPAKQVEAATVGYNRRPNVAYIIRWSDTESA